MRVLLRIPCVSVCGRRGGVLPGKVMPFNDSCSYARHTQFKAADFLPPGCRFRADILGYGTARDTDGVFTTYRIQVTRETIMEEDEGV